ncbi:acetoacetate decarboxylase [Thermoleophilia bacterium SCSIO 60948]|nr:acetoacetate decarboxylase [Thermoleophilia bacterium SCSIO 60948]
MAELKGFSSPRSPLGRANLVGPPPWHYVGDLLVVEYWADPVAAAAVLPDGLEPHPDGGRMAAMFIDWQSCGATGEELLDPSRSQYKEFFVTVNCLHGETEYAYCPYIWVDRDFALARGWFQGFPKKLGSVWITRSFGLDTAADPGVREGSVFAGTLAAYERRMATATVTLEGRSESGPAHTDPPIVNARHFPDLQSGHHDSPLVSDLVKSVSFDRAVSEVWEGSATLELGEAPGEELAALAPVRVGRGYRFTLGYSVNDLEPLTT